MLDAIGIIINPAVIPLVVFGQIRHCSQPAVGVVVEERHDPGRDQEHAILDPRDFRLAFAESADGVGAGEEEFEGCEEGLFCFVSLCFWGIGSERRGGGTNCEEEEIFSVRSGLAAVIDVEADIEATGVGR